MLSDNRPEISGPLSYQDSVASPGGGANSFECRSRVTEVVDEGVAIESRIEAPNSTIIRERPTLLSGRTGNCIALVEDPSQDSTTFLIRRRPINGPFAAVESLDRNDDVDRPATGQRRGLLVLDILVIFNGVTAVMWEIVEHGICVLRLVAERVHRVDCIVSVNPGATVIALLLLCRWVGTWRARVGARRGGWCGSSSNNNHRRDGTWGGQGKRGRARGLNLALRGSVSGNGLDISAWRPTRTIAT